MSTTRARATSLIADRRSSLSSTTWDRLGRLKDWRIIRVAIRYDAFRAHRLLSNLYCSYSRLYFNQ
ncbi:hypothetical protein GGQ85_001099 [Nitrobacter vulgaris]|nr:hypothetical protein [Nitrobacter vulgaris]